MNFNFLAILAFLFLNSLIFNGGKIPLRRLSEEKTNRVDFRGLRPGIYNMILIHNDKLRITKRVVKQ